MEISLFFVLLLAGIFHAESKFMVYDTSPRLVPGKINVHLVAHTHDDVGWLKTVDQYYVGSNNSIQGACVQNVLDSMVPALLADKNRKFIYVEQAFFQRWWRDQSETIQGIVKQLVRSGQLEFINGGMCMHDEAATHYIDMVDQTTLGHRFLKKEFGVTPRIGWQIDPFGHSAVQAYLLGAEVGFDALYFGRIDYQDRDKRKGEKSLEVVWRASRNFDASAQIFAGAFPENYEPPPGDFYFEVNDDSPIVQDDVNLFDYNVQDRVNDFVAAAVSQANITRTNHIMWTMGTDFKYQYAHTWFRQMDKLIHYVNKDGRVNALYSTPSIYTDAKFATNESWPIKTDDFFPYADSANAYWTGYFTSRPAIKRYVRMMSGYYLAARQLEFFKGRSDSGPTTDALADALAIAQHHDAVTGTEKQHVASDYAKRLSMGYDKAEELVAASLACLAESMPSAGCGNPTTKFQQCVLLNISYCPPSEIDLSHGKKLIVVVYNSLGWKRDDVIRIPVINEDVTVHDSNGKVIESQILPLTNAHVGMRNYYVKAYLGKTPSEAPKYWLAFSASVPPLGFSTYTISRAERTASTLTTSSVFTPRAMEPSTVEVGQGNLRLTFSADVGKMTHYTNSRSLVKEPVQLSYSFYTGNDGSDKDPQASGAYIFRPNRTFVIKPEEELQSPLTVMRGPLLDEVHQRINPWIYQVTRLYKGKEHAEVEFAVGPIPIDDGIGKEVATQITTTMATNKTFYTDSNGRDFIKRIRDYRTDWDLKVNQPVAGNYYPETTKGYSDRNGWEGHKFMRRLQFVKAKLKVWNRNTFGMLKERKKTILDEIANIDVVEQEGVLSLDLSAKRVIRKGELEEVILMEEIHWRQKAKVKWVKDGDCYSKLFHKVANGRRNRNFIKSLENERGLVLNNSESITEEILLYFKKLYSNPPGESWGLEGIDWSPISEESASRLDSPFSEEEIFNAIFQLDREKAPGPDGFTIAVFQDCWDVIKDDLVRVFAEFHSSGIINQNTNASFIVLLPKKSQSKKISDFRPISLITCLYKVMAKVLSGRLRGVLHETIHFFQGAFVQGRQILDAVLIANEIVDEKRRSGEEGIVFKIDFGKAYDHVKWDFLDHMLEMKGFSSKWRIWMRGCLSSVSYAILVNGNAKGWVKASRGLRQGDPLSPFLFTIVADVLSRMMLKAEERSVLEGFRVGRNRIKVSHLQFANDTIFFANSCEEELQTLKSLLLVFRQISGLKVNLDKSNLFGINLDQNHLSRLALMLDCKVSDWPISYLGLPLGGNPTACGFWNPVIERISRRLDGWQKAYLSFGGRITLVHSCLSHIPSYFISLFKIPASVAAKIERLQRDFLWSGVGEGKRDHLVSWDAVCKPRVKGGLGFGKIPLRNRALLGKWLWRFPRESTALWHRVILSIYGTHSNGWDANTLVRWSHRCPWKAIAQVFQDFSKYTRFVVGNGERIRFWEDL